MEVEVEVEVDGGLPLYDEKTRMISPRLILWILRAFQPVYPHSTYTNTAEKQQKNQVFDFMNFWTVRTLRCDPHPHPKTPRGEPPEVTFGPRIWPVFCPVIVIESPKVIETLAKSIICHEQYTNTPPPNESR